MEWKDINIAKYQQILAITKTDLPDFNKDVQLVSYLFDIPLAEVMQMPISSFQEYDRRLSFLDKMPEEEAKPIFTINGIDYKVHWEMHTKTAGQFIDLTELTKDTDMVNDNLHMIMAVLCSEVGKPYDGTKVMERAELFREHMTMDFVLPVAAFFLTIFEHSLRVIAGFSIQNLTKEQKKLREMLVDSMHIGDGTAPLMN